MAIPESKYPLLIPSLPPPQQWEMLLVSKLGWDLLPVTACDFVDQLVALVPLVAGGSTTTQRVQVSPLLRRHANTFVQLATTGE